MTRDEAIDKAFLAHDACFNYQAGKAAFLRALAENGLVIVPKHPVPAIINAGHRAGGQTVSATFRVWRAMIAAAHEVDELLDSSLVEKDAP